MFLQGWTANGIPFRRQQTVDVGGGCCGEVKLVVAEEKEREWKSMGESVYCVGWTGIRVGDS